MKLLLGKVLIETDHIESAEIIAPHTVKLHFVSGHVLDVVCGVKTTGRATWCQDASGFITTLLNTDKHPIQAKKKAQKKRGGDK